MPDLAGALPWALKAAEAGHVEAAGLLGYIYSSGPDDIKDEQKALKWYEIAHEKGSPQGGSASALRAFSRHRTKARSLSCVRRRMPACQPLFSILAGFMNSGLSSRATMSVPRGIFRKRLKAALRRPRCVTVFTCSMTAALKKTFFQAETWLRRAVLKGEAEAAAILGDLNIRGFDHAPNFEDAGGWYRLAAEMGHAAAEIGDSVASADFGNLALIGVGSESQKSDLSKRFMTEAEDGSLVAAFNLGVCLAQGVDTEENPQASIQWFKVAAKGVVNAQYWLGRLYGGEFGVEADSAASVEWLEKAVDAQDAGGTGCAGATPRDRNNRSGGRSPTCTQALPIGRAAWQCRWHVRSWSDAGRWPSC
ncbi:MAG: tetratricopeptide repeat protein [Acetobacteraceae bacterium]